MTTEHLHITEVKHPFCAMNHYNFEEQCTRILDWLEHMKLFNFFCKFPANGDLKPSNPVVTEAALTAEQDLHPVLPLTMATCEEIVMSQCPMQNHFLKGVVSSNSLAVFCLNKTPDIASISIGEATYFNIVATGYLGAALTLDLKTFIFGSNSGYNYTLSMTYMYFYQRKWSKSSHCLRNIHMGYVTPS
ncbi:hypothetical protein EDB83DRAFT_2538197 [Lactarius deliciosus]|nr:hypothetical protein EDB83DRAFT_2538197 [Lactarius deliciosus]